jgi:4-amino-4-deoxy-L-arabinose transferase-like glycosyltransferase
LTTNSRFTPALWTLLWAVLVIGALALRPLLPVDETRYATVAWEMWHGGDWLVPHLNGEAYSHKPPLLFWLIDLSWAVFGVNDWTERLIAPLFALAALFLTQTLGRRLWADARIALTAPLLLIGTIYWGLFSTLTMFDLMIALWTLVGLIGLVEAPTRPLRGWGLFALGIGLGVLSKGPVILIFLLPAALAAPWWLIGDGRPARWGRWYLGVLAGTLGGAVIALFWAVPAGISGGAAYRDAIFWGQSAGRVVDSFAHRHPFWWYLEILPGLILPWLVWPSLWRAVFHRGGAVRDKGLRLITVWAGAGFLILSAISGKAPHYPLPLFPALALGAAALLARLTLTENPRKPWLDALPLAFVALVFAAAALAAPELAAKLHHPQWANGVSPAIAVLPLAAAIAMLARPRIEVFAAGTAALVVALHLVLHPALMRAYDLRPISQHLKGLQDAGATIGFFGNYHGEFNFVGRLPNVIDELDEGELAAWSAAHPGAKVVVFTYQLPASARPEFQQPFRSGILSVWDATAIVADPSIAVRGERASLD